MIHRWDLKTKNSPFRLNCVAHEENRMAVWDDMEYRKQQTHDRNETLKNMIGTSKFDVCSKDKIQVFDDQNEVLLALALRRQTSDRRIVGHERSTLNQMIDLEFCDMSNKFPQIPALRSIVMSSRNHMTEGCSSRDNNSRGMSRDRLGLSRSSATNSKGRNDSQHRSRSPPGKGRGRGGGRDASSSRRSADSSVMGGSLTDSLESGSGSIYKPPVLNPAEKFGRELDLSFPQI
jgi:hypothetical protein